jgi:hypothetical protein
MRVASSAGASLRSGLIWAAPLAGYSALACALTWPLPRHLHSRLLGAVSGDLGVYIWNLWIFRHELVEHGRMPFSTDHVFAYTDGADFSLHNYTPLADALGVPLIGMMGLVGAFNVLLLAKIVLTALAMFLLCRRLGVSSTSAWIAGALFVASPVMVARQTTHVSLVAAAALPLFLWALSRALDSGRRRDGALVGAVVAIATYSDAYYGVYCALMGVGVLGGRFLRVRRGVHPRERTPAIRAVDALSTVAAGLIIWRLVTGATAIELGPARISIATLYNPMLALMLLALLRAWLTWRPRVTLQSAQSVVEIRRLVAGGLVACATCLVLLLPLLAGIALRFQTGRLPETVTLWRSSPRGVDLLAYLAPNPNHPLTGRWTHDLFLPDRSDAFPEFVAAFPWIALVIIGLTGARRALPAFWVAFTLFFVALSLGPFVHVGGHNTYVAGPWALLRYVPIVDMARSPARFVILATLGGSVLCAFALDWWRRAVPWRNAIAVVFVIAAAVELLPAPRPLYSAEIPALYELVARATGPSTRVLELPTGVRDGTSSIGDFNASSMYFQTRHGRPLIGGYLSRVSERRKRENLRLPMLRALIALSQPGVAAPPAWLEEGRAASRRFLSRSCVGFVVVDKWRATSDLRSFAVDALHLEHMSEDGRYELLVPIDPPPCQPRGANSAD